MPQPLSMLFHRPVRSTIRARRGGLEVRSFVRDTPGLVVIAACFGLFLWAAVTALREGSPGGWVALLFALVLAYPLARRLGGSGAILATPAGLSQQVRFSRREFAWDDVADIADDLGGHVVVTTRSGSRVELLTLGLPPVAWGPQLEDWRADPQALAARRVEREVELLRGRVEALSLR